MGKLYNPERGRMRVAGLMSGSGSNLRKIIDHQKHLERAPYEVVVIFTDNPQSNATRIGGEYEIPVVVRDLGEFYHERQRPRRDMALRKEFDRGTVELLKPYGVDVAAYAGYMAIATEPLVNAFLGVNVHPADLTIMDGTKRKYTGANAVRDAILAGEERLRSTTHIIAPRVDYGGILMISEAVPVILPQDFDTTDTQEVNRVSCENQERLKERGDWVVFPRTLELIAEGRYSRDSEGRLYFDGNPIPQGVRLTA